MASTSANKRCVYVFNILCLLLAAVLIGFGIFIVATYDVNEIGDFAAYAFIAISVATVVVVVFLNIAVIRESTCCTITFIIILIVTIIGQSVVAFMLITGVKTVASNVANILDDAWDQEMKSPGAMDIYQNWLHCCGRSSPQDYIVDDQMPPNSCFINNDSSTPENLIESGCRLKFENYWIDLLKAFSILAWILVGLEILLSIVSCYLCNKLRNEKRRSYA